MENLLEALQSADRICKQAYVHLEKAAQMEQEIPGLSAKLKKERIPTRPLHVQRKMLIGSKEAEIWRKHT